MRRLLLVLLAVLVVLLAVNTVVMNRETEAAKAAGGLVIDLPGGDLRVRDGGPRDAPAVVLLHGYACSMGWWDGVAPALARDHRVITFDLLGHGGSEKPRDGYGMESQARLVSAALDRLDVRKATVVGHSMGGAVATALVQERRALVDSLVILDSNSDKDDRHLPFTARLGYVPVLGQAIRRVVPDSMIRNGLESAFADGFEVPDRFVDDFREMTYTSYDESPSASDDYREGDALADRLKNDRVPLLVIFGSEDELVDAEAAQDYRTVPGARIVVLDGVGHSPHVERPAATTRLIRNFLRTQARR
jgi:pimeloyl-ACP methyl ester carboxylesterase